LSEGLHIQQASTGCQVACATFRESRPTDSSSIMHTKTHATLTFDL